MDKDALPIAPAGGPPQHDDQPPAHQVWLQLQQLRDDDRLEKKINLKILNLQESFTFLGDASENGSTDGLRTNRDRFW